MTTDGVEPGTRPCRDLVLMCADSGALVAVTIGAVTARAIVFLASGETYGVTAPGTDARRGRVFELDRSEADGRQRLRLSCSARELAGPAELPGGEPAADGPRVPLGVDVTLEPLSMPVAPDDPTSPGSVMTAQGVRMSGSLAVGSVIHRLSGHGWASRSGFSAPATRSGTRVQAAFQDGSGLLATRAGQDGGSAALLVHTRTSVLPVHGLHVTDRGPSTVVDCVLGGRAPGTVTGKLRHADQHIAFLRPSGDGWVRIGYMPLDVVRSGVTGFGLVEHITQPARADPSPGDAADLPDPF